MPTFSTYARIIDKNQERCPYFDISSFTFSSYNGIIMNKLENKPKFCPNPKLKLMDQVREVLRYHIIVLTT